MKILRWILLGICAFVIGVCLYLAAVAVLPGFEVPQQPLKKITRVAKVPHERPPVPRKNVSIAVSGASLSAWLYLPLDTSTPVPCIVMASGLGGTKDMGLDYSLRFQDADFAVLVETVTMDYNYASNIPTGGCWFTKTIRSRLTASTASTTTRSSAN